MKPSRGGGSAAAWLRSSAIAVFALSVGCAGSGDEIPEGPVEIGIAGIWVVATEECAGECAPGTPPPGRWVGARAEFTDTLVVFGDTECRAPVYRAAVELTAPSEDGEPLTDPLGFGAGRLVQIDCSGVRWRSPGAVLVVESPTVARAMWEGKVLRLSRPGG